MSENHNPFDSLIAAERDRHRERITAIYGSQRLAARYGLLPLVRYATYVNTHQDYIRSDDGTDATVPADRYWLTIHIPASLKPRLRPVALDQINSWDKTYRVDHGIFEDQNDLHEIWRVELNHIRNHYFTAYDLIEIHWTAPAESGTRLTPTCTVAEVEQRTEARVKRNLQVVCSKA